MRAGGKIAWAALGALIGLLPRAGLAQPAQNIVVALPSATLTFTAPFIAQDAGYYKDEGFTVSQPILVGVASTNAVINGSAEFTIGTGPVFLRAAAHGQRLLAIANLMDRPNVELVLRKDVYQELKITDGMSLAERGKLLKGLTIAIQGVGSIVHAWPRLIAARGGLDPEADMRIAPMEPPSMLPALETKAVDGYTTSLPFTTAAVLKGVGVIIASAPLGAVPDILPFAGGLVYAKPETCRADAEKCRRFVRALARAVALIRDKPNEALDIVRGRFKEMDPKLIDSAWAVVAQAYTKDIRPSPLIFENSEKVNVEAKLLDPKDRVTSFDGLFTDQFVP